MSEYLKETTGAATLGIWRIDEDEEALKHYIGGDSFPVLQQFTDKKRRLEWLALRSKDVRDCRFHCVRS